MEVSTFFKAFGVSVLFILLMGGLIFWIVVAIRRAKLDLWIKYKFFKKKYSESDIAKLLQYKDAGKTPDDIEKLIFLSGTRTPSQIRELLYLYEQLHNLKGGIKQ